MLIPRFLRLFFEWLYHPLAFAYDLVAATVSFGCWNDWVRNVIPFIHGTRILELGHGPGHLQRSLRSLNLVAVGLDESAQMGRLAKRRLLKDGETHINLARGLAQALPFPSESFDSVLSTFPSGYIFEAQTLSEARRVLHNGGRLIVLPAAWPKNPLLGWLFKVTGESPSETQDVFSSKLKKPFVEAGFEVEIQMLDIKSGYLIFVVATKKEVNHD
jgi:ubiquinone/menaquinone biosynthesis C-methylase UbiE